MIDGIDIHRERDGLHMHGGNLARMLDACRVKGRVGNSGYTTSVVRMTCDSYRNALEAMLATISEVETECLLICHQREKNNPIYSEEKRAPLRRSSELLPATVSPALFG